MAFNNFYLRITGYALLMVLTSLAFAWSLYQPYMVATSSGLGLLLALETFALIRYNQRIKNDLQRFIDAVKNQDTSLAFPRHGKDPLMKELHQGFNEIITDFRLVRKEKELEHHFFQNTLRHIGIGVLAFHPNGSVKLQNKAFLNLFNLTEFKSLPYLKKCHKDLPDLLHSLKNGEESLLKMMIHNEPKNISIRVSDIKLENERIRIASFQDISREMNRQEVESWQKLIRVLRHEIMNSISPIRIMSGNLLKRVSGDGEKLLSFDGQSREIVSDLKEGLQTIRKRSAGLSDFVETYRHLSRIPEPRFTEIRLENLFGEVFRLFEKDLPGRNITITRSVVPGHLTLTGDEQMLEQVLINLVKNAVEAIEEKALTIAHDPHEPAEYQGKIELRGYQQDNHTVLSITDNGPGIPEDQIESIFVPFYTTRERGSGIGLSLSRQLIQVHNGSMQIKSQQGKGAEVRVRL
jgi:nitrogen fixation/metabolism regulation signal transduction histidine kinase